MEQQTQESAAAWFAEEAFDLTGKLITVLEKSCEDLADVPVEMVRALFKTALGNALEEIILLPATTKGLGMELAHNLKQRQRIDTVVKTPEDKTVTLVTKGRKPRKNVTNSKPATNQIEDTAPTASNNFLFSGESQVAGIVVKQGSDTYPM